MSLISTLKKTNDYSLFTTPSHAGKFFITHKFYQWYKNDISETDFYNPVDALKESESKTAKIFGTKSTRFLTNGSTSGIIASVLASVKQGEKLLIWKNSHPCHRHAGILAGANIIEYELPYNKDWGIYEKLSPKDFESLISKHSPKAVIVTSPTYEGIVSDIKEFSKISKKSGVILIVDEAHGALYPFSEELPESAVGHADFTVQSLHKTAGGLNPTALVHTNTELNLDYALSLINTTSPSYPMLGTIEANINYLNSNRGRKKIHELIKNIEEVKVMLKNIDFYGDDITKLLIKKDNLTGFELSEILYNKYKIEDERANEKSVLLLTGLGTTPAKLARLAKLKSL